MRSHATFLGWYTGLFATAISCHFISTILVEGSRNNGMFSVKFISCAFSSSGALAGRRSQYFPNIFDARQPIFFIYGRASISVEAQERCCMLDTCSPLFSRYDSERMRLLLHLIFIILFRRNAHRQLLLIFDYRVISKAVSLLYCPHEQHLSLPMTDGRKLIIQGMPTSIARLFIDIISSDI